MNKTSEVDYKQLFAELPRRYIVVQPDDPHFTIVDENVVQTIGLLRGNRSSIGKHLSDLLPDIAETDGKMGKHEILASLRKVTKTKKPNTIETLRYDHPDTNGTYTEKLWRVIHKPIYDSSGKLLWIMHTAEDVTEEKRNEANLRFLAQASTELSASLNYRKTLRTIAKLMVPEIADWCSIELLDEHGKPQTVGLAHKDPAKIQWAEELRRQQGPPDMSAPNGLPNVIRTGEAEYYPEIGEEMLRAAAKDEEEFKLAKDLGLYSAIIVPLKISGETVGAISLISAEQKRSYTEDDLEMAKDLAERASLAMTNSSLYENSRLELKERERLRKQLEDVNTQLEARVHERTQELEKANLNLLRSNNELEDFAYVASHDLQEPLRKIQAFSNILESEYSSQLGDGQDYLLRMRNAAARMSTLIQDLLSFSRVTTQAHEFTKVNLQTIAEEVISDLETRIKDTGGTVTLKKLPSIYADPLQMRQLLQNLISNALKFHKPDVPPLVQVSATITTPKSGKMAYCTLTVKDNGVGFDEKYLDRIFAVFQRLHGRDAYEGTGIGLAVCRKIVERHSGTITAKSTPGNGATFIIKLPVKHTRKG